MASVGKQAGRVVHASQVEVDAALVPSLRVAIEDTEGGLL
jgi:hypothetical protein